MKKSKRKIVNNARQTQSFSNRKPNHTQTARALSLALRVSYRHALAFVAVITIAAGLTLSLADAPPAQAQLGSPPFANPSEIRYNPTTKTMRATIELISGEYQIPNGVRGPLRQFRGWDPAQPKPTPNPNISPGPTLRARVGDRVEVLFFNRIDDSKFPYTFDTSGNRGLSGFGCDKSGKRDPKTGIILPYPGNDTFPNCFHGSSTANIHFHGTHTTPDGLGDNVLVQVLPQVNQPDWTKTFDKMFDSGKIPQKWADMPEDYRNAQVDMIDKHDKEAAAAAEKNKLPPPEALGPANQHMIVAGEWPQYIMGAFPNFFDIPDYDAKKPDGTRKYKAGQAPGTHWYHAHKHGSTSLHILNGLAGVFIIESNKEGGYDHVIRKHYGWGDTYGDHEKVIVLQQFDPTQNLERLKPPGSPVVLVNGKLTPTITMKPGEVQLWRIVNATEGNGPGITQPSLFQTPGFNFMQTAQDGVQLSQINYACQPFLGKPSPQCTVKDPVPIPGGLTLAGGNRADVLVQAPLTTGLVAFKSGKATLFYVNVAGTAVKPPNGPFPTFWPDLPKFLDDLPAPPPKDVQTPVQFQWEADRAGAGRNAAQFPPHFMLNGKQFGEKGEVIDQCMPLNAVQDWILENYTTVAHPFHIHINPFQVIQIDTPTAFGQYTTFKPLDNYVWQDVVAIPAGTVKLGSDNKTPVQPIQITPGRVRIRQSFLDFTGTFVLHCHILAHEDRGMMQLVRVVPADKYPGGCQGTIPDHH